MKVPSTKVANDRPSLSRLILGGWRWNDKNFTKKDQDQLINTSLDLGITTFDHADIYGNYNCQYLFGKYLKEHKNLREKIEIVTKCGIKPVSRKFPERIIPHYDTSKAHIVDSANESLTALETDYIDVLLIHRPAPLMDADEIAEAFTELKNQGKVKYFGVSNFSNQQFDLIQSRLDFPLVTNQIEINMDCYDSMFDGTLDHMQQHRVIPMAWSPLGGGKIFSNRSLVAKLKTFAKKYDVSLTGLILSWLMMHPAKIHPILGTTNSERVLESAPSVNVKMERQDWYLILKIIRGFDVP